MTKDYRILKSCREDVLARQMAEANAERFEVEQFAATSSGIDVVMVAVMSRPMPGRINMPARAGEVVGAGR